MPSRNLRLTTVFTELDNGTVLAAPLFYPEVSAYERRRKKLISEIVRGVQRTREKLPRLELWRRHTAGEPDVREVTVELQPPRERALWISPLRLTFHVVVWTHGTAATVAYVPSLDIEVIALRPEDLGPMIEEHIRFALSRAKATGSLEKLWRYGRIDSVTAESVSAHVEDKTPKEIAREREKGTKKSVLSEVATHLPNVRHTSASGMEDTMLKMVDWLLSARPRSVLLVGPSGVGKTAAVYELARQYGPRVLGRTPFWTTSGARIVAGMSGYGMWQERCQELCTEAAKTKAIIHFGNLFELVEVGQCEGNDQGVASFLRPSIERGDLLAITECTAEQLKILERDVPNIIDAFVQVEVRQPDQHDGLAILRAEAEVAARRTKSRCSEDALCMLDRLHRRFATYSAFPGRPLRFLQNLMQDAAEGKTLAAADVTSAFSRETGLPRMLLEEEERLDLDQTRAWFRQRVIGQDQAVDVIVNLLATVKVGLSRPDKPIASLLFIGPTGVGKTELAKSLAEFLYQDRQRMTRIDMSEYADYASIDRLIGGTSRSEGILTAKVREQPFGVVLLDEFEKAHPRFFDLLLQVLGEGRLTDAAGRLADFRNSVIIMTSNLGTESFMRPTIGFDESADPAAHAESHFVRELQKFVRPEMFNRIDRVVPFLPLRRETLQSIARRELELLRMREGMRYRDLKIDFSDELADAIARLGYDPRYGARPIKRAIDRHLLAPLVFKLNDAAGDVPLEAKLSLGAAGIQAEVRARTIGVRDTPSASGPHGAATLVEVAQDATAVRRDVTRVDASYAMLNARNQIYRLQRLADRFHRRHTKHRTPQANAESLNRLAPLRKIVSWSKDIVARATLLEEKLLLALYTGGTPELDAARAEVVTLRSEYQQLMVDLYLLGVKASSLLSLVVYGEHPPTLFKLARAYYALAVHQRFQIKVYEILISIVPQDPEPGLFVLGDRDSDDKKLREQANGNCLGALLIDDVDLYLRTPRGGPLGLALSLSGKMVQRILEPEAGLHAFVEQYGERHCLVDTSVVKMPDYQPPERVDRKISPNSYATRRTYNQPSETIRDPITKTWRRWRGGDVTPQLGELVEEHFLARVKAWIEQ